MRARPYSKLIRSHAVRLVAAAVILGLYGAARPATRPTAERVRVAGRFHFASQPLPELPGQSGRTCRPVHPRLQHISAWISSVGAAVALNDLDGDGLPNDVGYVDTRSDRVIIAPVPGTPSRYAPFALDPAPLPYDLATMAPMGCLPGDFNEDGLMDILVYYWWELAPRPMVPVRVRFPTSVDAGAAVAVGEALER